MTNKEKFKRAMEILDEMYAKAQCALPEKLSWKEITEVCRLYTKDHYNKLQVPFRAYHIGEEEYHNILNRMTKGLHSIWHWARKAQIGEDGKLAPDPEYDEYKKGMDEMRRKKLRGEITYNDLRKWQKEQSEKYKGLLVKRCYDREDISFWVANYAPSSGEMKHIEDSEELREFWDAWEVYKNIVRPLPI